MSVVTGSAGAGALVDDAPAYDGLRTLVALVSPRTLGPGDWRAWAERTAGGLSVAQWTRTRRWFVESTAGQGLIALVPLLRGARGLPELADAVESAPLADFLRLCVTTDLTHPDAPTGADDLLALTHDAAAASRFITRYLRVSGRRRALVARTLARPEEARAEMVAALREHQTTIFAGLEPQLRDERARGAEALRRWLAETPDALERLAGSLRVEGFSPVVVAVSTMLGEARFTYYHEIRRTLVDSAPGYEPFILLVGARWACTLAERGAAEAGAEPGVAGREPADPAARWAQVYAALADPSRLRIARLLARRPYYGQELAEVMGISGASISHHLSALSRAGVLRIERRSHRTYVTLQTEELRALLAAAERYTLGAPGDAADGMVDESADAVEEEMEALERAGDDVWDERVRDPEEGSA